ncbi:MAG: hypothetical protein ACAH07_05905 [Methylophilaceae bacterium]|nr:hypothetical protein [Methyloradius sp.]
MSNSLQVIIPNEAELLDAAETAAAAGYHLLSNGVETVISPFMIPGWFKMAVVVKPQPEAVTA